MKKQNYQYQFMKILTQISTFSVNGPVTKDVLVAMKRTLYNQMLFSK